MQLNEAQQTTRNRAGIGITTTRLKFQLISEVSAADFARLFSENEVSLLGEHSKRDR